MEEVARMYGFEPNRNHFIRCPFHDERTASLSIKGNHWHCFGCNEGGSVIDFVMKLCNLPFPAAVVRLNSDFHLGLTNARPAPDELARLRRERMEADRARRLFEADYDARCREFRRLWAAKRDKAPHSPSDPIDPEYAEACLKLDGLDWWFQEHPYKKEVSTYRRVYVHSRGLRDAGAV